MARKGIEAGRRGGRREEKDGREWHVSPSVQDHSLLPTVQRQCEERGLEAVVRIHNLQPTKYNIISMVSNICKRLRPTMSEMQDATWRREGRENNPL